MPSTRISFAEAISEKRLLKPWIDKMSMFQRTWLKVMYGCPLDGNLRDDRGFTELEYWAASQGQASYDDLGYIKSVQPLDYKPLEYDEVWGITGIRGGKTDRLGATIVAYEAICGGHEDHRKTDRPIICLQIAQDIRMAKYSLHSISTVLKSMSFLKADSPQSWITNTTADRIELKNRVHIMVTPPTVKAIRGYDSPVAVLDEVGIWYQDADSANPDFEIYDQVGSRQAQFTHPKIVGISSPWNRGGILYQRYEAGTNGHNVRCDDCLRSGRQLDSCETCVKARLPHKGRLILHSSSAASNPIITRNWLQGKLHKDPRNFERECLARFQDSLSGFLPSVLIEKARAKGITQRDPVVGNFYIAAIDPAFRRDAFAFTVVHCDPKVGIIQDYVERWFDPTGTARDPGEIFAAIAPILKLYNIKSVYSDQWSFEALNYLAQQHNFSIEEVTFTGGSKAEIYGNLQQLLRQRRISLLDHPETIAELKSIEKKNTQGGQVQIAAPEGQHDDLATVIAIAAHEAVWMLPKEAAAEPPKKNIIERHIEHVAAARRKIQHDQLYDLDW